MRRSKAWWWRRRAAGTVAFFVSLGGAPASAQTLEHVGDFHNVSTRDGGEHCSGYSLRLWKHRQRVLGLLAVHAGLCGDPPCAVIEEAVVGTQTGTISFSALIQDRKFVLAGKMTQKGITATINNEPTVLVRDTDSTTNEFAPNRDVSAWCAFWGSVPRCTGVRELCNSLQSNRPAR